MANNDVIELLDILYGMVTEAWGVPLGNDKCIIEREKAIEIISEIKASLPSSVAEAQRLVSARDEFIGNAKREAEAMRKNAEEQSRSMIEEQEVIRVARARSNEMLSAAEAKSNELRRLASEYVENLMRQTEANLSAALDTVRGAHSSFKAVDASSARREEPQPVEEKPEQPKRPLTPPPVQRSGKGRLSANIQTISRDEEG